MMTNRIHPATTPKTVSLTVADLEAMTRFYQKMIGLTIRSRAEQQVWLGSADADIINLIERPAATRLPGRPGLYHLALLLPARRDLGDWLNHIARQRYPIQGASDHLVSEAIYLDDPEGNGIEVYRDRPRSEWPMQGREVRMATDPLDLEGLLAAGSAEGWQGAPKGTTLGHVHLHVNDLRQAERFYVDLLGFDLMQRYPGALFISAGGYHHHLGLNTWGSAGAPPPPPNTLGLHSYSLALPDHAEQKRLVERLQAADYSVEDTSAGPLVRDPAGNALILAVA
jgi:catechol 2,3-dioxygenase